MTDSAPDWDLLHGFAAAQSGHFTLDQAEEAGFSGPSLSYHVRAGNLLRPTRGVYRLARFPPGEHEDLVAPWLASAGEGVFSHETALSLHRLSDALPSRHHLTLPPRWRRRVLPGPLALHFADVAPGDRAWFGPVRVTTPARTLLDCIAGAVSPEVVGQAFREAQARGLLADDALARIRDRARETLYRSELR
jgi:predicted transcriptional regulator of viral defense system